MGDTVLVKSSVYLCTFSGSLFRKTFIVLYSVVDMKIATKSYVLKEKKEHEKMFPTLSTLSPTDDQSWREVVFV